MSVKTLGLDKRQIESMVAGSWEKMKFDIIREYTNILVRQGRARDTGSVKDAERDMEAMCDAYARIFVRIFSQVIESNNKKITDELKDYLAEE
ncbi:MAG: hypothetical protein AB7V50_00730 [Vampirovibrionia bacterium]